MIINRRSLFHHFLLLVLCLPAVPTYAQTGSLSPYSRYGIGDVFPAGFSRQSGMGGIGSALIQPAHLNPANPASYIADSTVVFDFGGRLEVRSLKNRNGDSKTFTGASFANLALAFPLIRGKASAAFGLVPYSSVGYDISVDESDVPDIGTIRYLYEGNGGINKVFLGAGFRLAKGLSAGVNCSFLFGNIEQIKSVEFPYGTNFYNSRYVNAVAVRGLNVEGGLIYERKLRNGLTFTSGLNANASNRVRAINSQYYFTYTHSDYSGSNVLKDSVFNEQEVNGHLRLPVHIAGGFTLGHSDRWLMGMDVAYTNWDQFENFDAKDSLKNTYEIRAGAERSFDRMIIRLGGHFGNAQMNLRETTILDYGITFGISLKKLFPKRPPSLINLGVDLGQRGTTDNNLIKEQYIHFRLGFSFTDIWFIKPKYD